MARIGEEERVDMYFRQALKDTKNDYKAAAIMALAKTIGNFHEDLSHLICLGVRHGLYGGDADANASLYNLDFRQGD